MAGRSMSEEEQAAMKRQVKKELKKKLGRKPTKEEVSAEVEVRTLATKSDQAGAAEELVPTKSELKQKQKKEKKDAKKEKKDAKKEKKSKKKKSDVDGAAEPPEAKNTKGKKRKVGEGVEAAVESVEAQSMSVDDSGVAEEQEVPAGKRARKQNVPFRRVKDEEIEVAPELADNSYEGTFGESGWGAKASADLIVTKGKSFRHEKNKKKRGSYRGGQIDIHAVNSVKKTFDDWPE